MVSSPSELEYARNYYLANKHKWLAYGKKYREAHREFLRKKYQTRHVKDNQRLNNAEMRHLQKIIILSHYSNPQGVPICNNCGEWNIDVLCLDHVDGGGKKHLKELSGTLYNWIVKNSFPNGFQVLCANCNLAKARLELHKIRKVFGVPENLQKEGYIWGVLNKIMVFVNYVGNS